MDVKHGVTSSERVLLKTRLRASVTFICQDEHHALVRSISRVGSTDALDKQEGKWRPPKPLTDLRVYEKKEMQGFDFAHRVSSLH